MMQLKRFNRRPLRMQRFMHPLCLTHRPNRLMMNRPALWMLGALTALCFGACSKNAALSPEKRNGFKLLGTWRAVGYYSTYFMAPDPSRTWVDYASDEQFTYTFKGKGELKTNGMHNGCPYRHYRLTDSVHLQLAGADCGQEKYELLRVTADSLYLGKPWYENYYLFVFVRVDHQ